MRKFDVPNWEDLFWNGGDDWAIPLPLFSTNDEGVLERWYVADESPVIPTGWIYRLVTGQILTEYRLWCLYQYQDVFASMEEV